MRINVTFAIVLVMVKINHLSRLELVDVITNKRPRKEYLIRA